MRQKVKFSLREGFETEREESGRQTFSRDLQTELEAVLIEVFHLPTLVQSTL
ncbi:hypothetical protein CCHR01_11318 [Colletotrichum chrysophilum]|uniref:Uncharacterized protein n=1 Tax=Colletotrichum chrysophilum TaxID=1836956 RepID=A0AAD9AED3_9PEZI|nr:hypothetical protein K456DRAFT_55788 [Colletotrichum gloeosporioides 23]KAK1846072.1 hypothetical protein CCHR01_11318 [Colletotrichum chrysophilum]